MKTIQCTWVKGRYEDDKARYILGLIEHGIGYFILEKGKDGNKNYIVAASLTPLNKPLPLHMSFLTNYENDKVETMYRKRNPMLCEQTA